MKKIRVYDHRNGDFTIEIPDNAEVTFGYFNPAAADGKQNKYGQPFGGDGAQTMKTSALRVYQMVGKKKFQIGCFLGVSGFRDEEIKLTRLSQKVIIETNMSSDDEGNIDSTFKQQRQITARPEPGSYQ